jgi:hypothetical protein
VQVFDLNLGWNAGYSDGGFSDFAHSRQANARVVLQLGYDHCFLNFFKFIIHQPSCYFMLFQFYNHEFYVFRKF